MSRTFGQTTLGGIREVRTHGGDTATYFCKLTMVFDGEAPEEIKYVARATDTAETGQWVYQQIVAGNFAGEIIDMPEGVDAHTGLPPPDTSVEDTRIERDKRLAATDWTQHADIPQATKDKWAPYRQALRDVPQQAGFPETIDWPTPPQ
jgi:hypothetical protein